MKTYLRAPRKINVEKWQICSKCWEFLLWSFFEENNKTHSWYKTKCKKCEELEQIKLKDDEIINNKILLDDVFFNDEIIKTNLRILWKDYNFSDEDKFFFLSNKWYNKKWLSIIYWKTYRFWNLWIDDI